MAFFALPITPSADFLATFAEWQQRWPQLAWSHPDDLHLTLRFLRLREGSDIQDLIAAADQADFGAPFPLVMAGLSRFDFPQGHGVLWLALKHSPPALVELQARCERLVQTFAYPPETRPFVPHITLARFKADDAPLAIHLCQMPIPKAGEQEASSVALMHRRSSGHGRVYQSAASWPLSAQSGPERLR